MQLTVRIPGDAPDAVELTALAYEPFALPSFQLRVGLRFGAFAGASESVFVEAEAATRFLAQLATLEQLRRGEALLEAMSPEEFQLTVRSVDAAGHLLVTARLLQHTYRHGRHVELAVSGTLALDSGLLPTLLSDLRLALQPPGP